tara:strand:+ start:447 stop:776 length:330 start_codon:yes stop_codon:yes gene_type:complete
LSVLHFLFLVAEEVEELTAVVAVALDNSTIQQELWMLMHIPSRLVGVDLERYPVRRMQRREELLLRLVQFWLVGAMAKAWLTTLFLTFMQLAAEEAKTAVRQVLEILVV